MIREVPVCGTGNIPLRTHPLRKN